jgi:hypothetical protein
VAELVQVLQVTSQASQVPVEALKKVVVLVQTQPKGAAVVVGLMPLLQVKHWFLAAPTQVAQELSQATQAGEGSWN